MYKHKDMSIRIDSKSFNIGDVSTLNNNEIRLFDNSQYWTEHTISWIKYSSGAHGRWLGAINFINGKKIAKNEKSNLIHLVCQCFHCCMQERFF